MKFRQWLIVLVGTFILPSCSPTTPPTIRYTITQTKQSINTPISVTASITPSVIITETHTSTEIVDNCDIYVSYCIMEDTFIFQRPIGHEDNDSIDTHYRFGSTMDGLLSPHHGVEFENPTGTAVIASYDGEVVFIGDDSQILLSPWKNFYGNVVIIQHDTPFSDLPILYTVYGHLSSTQVAQGQKVEMGEQVGEVGLSGSAYGSHLHFEIRRDAFDYFSVLNPELFLVTHRDEEYRGGIAFRIISQSLDRIDTSLNIQFYPQQDSTPTISYQIHTYEDPDIYAGVLLNENAAISDLPPGDYRISLILAGILYEKWAKIESGKLTYMGFDLP